MSLYIRVTSTASLIFTLALGANLAVAKDPAQPSQPTCAAQCQEEWETCLEARDPACNETAVAEATERKCAIIARACTQSLTLCQSECPGESVQAETGVEHLAAEPVSGESPASSQNTYAARLEAITAADGSDQSYVDHRANTWAAVKELALDERAPREVRIGALAFFTETFDDGNRHLTYANNLRSALQAGFATTHLERGVPKLRSENPRTKTEWVGLNAGAGLYGFNLSARFFNLRWDRFYWTILRGTATLGWMGSGAHLGTGIGFPVLISSSPLRELRFGLAVEAGRFNYQPTFYRGDPDYYGYNSNQDTISRGVDRAYGPVLLPEVVYHVRKPGGKVGFQVGLSASIYLLGESDPDYTTYTTDGGITHINYLNDGTTSFGGIPNFNLWAGITI